MSIASKYFNTAGPITPEDHYYIPPLERSDLAPIRELIDHKRYFILHAPRQTGKTTALITLAAQLRKEGHYRAIYTNVEVGQAARDNVEMGMRAMAAQLAGSAKAQGEPWFDQNFDRCWNRGGAAGIFKEFFADYSLANPDRPAVIFIDEVDSLVGDVLVSLLRQIRAGYPERPKAFPHAIVLCGVRDVRDYRITTSKGEIITGGSAFNIKDKSLRMGDFSQSEMQALLLQHTQATGQVFTPEVMELFWKLSYGQPWLVNALGRECCFEEKSELDRSKPITLEVLNRAKERLILSRATHLDALADKLQEDRVKQVIQPILAGDMRDDDVATDHFLYCLDLGLIRKTPKGYDIANPIYREVLPRELTWGMQDTLCTRFSPEWLTPEGSIDDQKLLSLFQAFYLQEGEIWADRFSYREAGVHLLAQAYFQRVVNGQGFVHREFPLGARRADLMLQWPLRAGGWQKIVIELKILRWARGPGEVQKTIESGVEQAADYAKRWKSNKAHLMVCSYGTAPEGYEREYRKEVLSKEGCMVEIWGM
jgi:hypothetical protein